MVALLPLQRSPAVQRIVPALLMVRCTKPLVLPMRFRVPPGPMVMAPVPASVPPLHVMAPVTVSVEVPVNVPPENVRLPTVSGAFTETVVATAKVAASAAPGTRFGFQFSETLQSPPAPLVQTRLAAREEKAASGRATHQSSVIRISTLLLLQVYALKRSRYVLASWRRILTKIFLLKSAGSNEVFRNNSPH